MVTQSMKETGTWSTTVIISNILKDHEVTRCLQSQHHKVRFSESVHRGSVIFPLSGFLANLPCDFSVDAYHESQLITPIEECMERLPIMGVAFLLVDAQELYDTPSEAVYDRIQQFMSVHRNSFLVIVSALHGPKEWDLIFCIQMRFLGSNLRIIPAHNSADVVRSMSTVTKATCKPHIENILDKLLQAKMHIVENSPVWKTLDQI